MRGRCAFTSTWDLTPDYSYFTWLFTILNEKEKRNEATERAIFIDFQGPFHPRTRQNIVRIVRLVSGLGISWQINSTRHPSPLAPSTKFIPKGNRMGALQHFNLVTTREFDGWARSFVAALLIGMDRPSSA